MFSNVNKEDDLDEKLNDILKNLYDTDFLKNLKFLFKIIF